MLLDMREGHREEFYVQNNIREGGETTPKKIGREIKSQQVLF